MATAKRYVVDEAWAMTRKKLLFIAACAVLVLLLVGFTGLGIYNRQQEQKLANAKKSVQQAVQSYNFNTQKPDDIEKSLGALYGQIQSLTVYTNAPGQSDFMKKSESIRQSIAWLTEYSTYSKKIGAMLADKQLGGKFVSSDDALAQAKKWQDFNDALKKFQAFALIQKQHDVLVASSANQVAIANKASDAYKANDATTIAAQSKAANDELSKIQAVYDDVYASVRVQQALIIVTTNKL
jgi:hypothetical protein